MNEWNYDYTMNSPIENGYYGAPTDRIGAAAVVVVERRLLQLIL
jgi:hypothetical protein